MMRTPSWLIWTATGLLVGAMSAACGSDDEHPAVNSAAGTAGVAGAAGVGGQAGAGQAGEAGGAGQAGAAGRAGDAGAAGAAGQAGAAGHAGAGGSSNCTIITVDDFESFHVEPNDEVGIFYGLISPNLDGPDDDLLALEFYSAESGTFDLASAEVNDNYETCKQCVLALLDGDSGRVFYQSAGTLTVDPSMGVLSGRLKATITGLELVEVTFDDETGETTPVPNGECLAVAGTLNIDVAPEAAR